MEYAIIGGGVVVNVVVSNDQSFIDEFYPGSPRIDQLNPKPGIGWGYNGSTFTPPAPPEPVPVPPQIVFTTQEFRRRYTFDELVAVDNCAPPKGSMGEQPPPVKDDDQKKMTTINTSVLAADAIDITNQKVIDAVNYEASLGLITAARAAEILDPESASPAEAWMF